MITRTRHRIAASMFAGIGVAATSQAVFAQAASDLHHHHHHLSVAATSMPVCTLSSPAISGSSVNASYAANTITLTQLIDPTTALVNQASLTLQIVNAMCNNNAWVSLRSQNGGLTSANSGVASGSGGFLAVIPYTVAATWGGLNLTLDTNSGVNVAKVPTGGANSGSLSLNVVTQKSASPVVQGTYSDVLTVKVGASF